MLLSLVLYVQPVVDVAADAFGHPVIYLTVVPAYQQLSHILSERIFIEAFTLSFDRKPVLSAPVILL